MKKIIKPAEREEAVYYSDFEGRCFGEFGPECTLKINFNYGSEHDGSDIEFHLTDEELQPILELIKSKLSVEYKKNIKKEIEENDEKYEDSIDSRDWQSCEYYATNVELLKKLL